MTRDAHIEKVVLMGRAYPSLQLVSPDGHTPLVWEGWLQPLLDRDQLDELIDDIENDRQVKIDRQRCVVVHDPDCRHVHQKHPLSDGIRVPTTLFKIRIEDFSDGRLPAARVLEPFIPKEDRRHHISHDGICAFAPWEYPWSPETSSIVTDFADHLLIWLVKQDIFSETKVWLGGETPHEPPALLAAIKPYQHCFCGSGKSFASCHRLHVGYEVFGKSWLVFEAWWAMHNEDLTRFERITALITPPKPKSLATSN